MLPTPTTSREFMMSCLMATARRRVIFHRYSPSNSGSSGSGASCLSSGCAAGSAAVNSRLPKRRGSLKRSVCPESSSMSTWSCAMRGVDAGSTRSEPDMPRCRISVPASVSSNRYLARRPARRIAEPATAALRLASTGQRNRRSCTSRRLMRRPTTCGSMPRRVVSTSGSSGTCWRWIASARRGLPAVHRTACNPLGAKRVYVSTNDRGWRRNPPAREPVRPARPERLIIPPPPRSQALRPTSENAPEAGRPPGSKKKAPPVSRRGLFRLAFMTPDPLRGGREIHLGLLDLRFLVSDVLAHDRIVFLHFHLVGVQALVLRGHVKMAGAGGRQQFHFLAHGLNLLALGTQVRDHGVDAVLFDGAQAARGHAQGNPATLGLQPEALGVQIGQEAATLLVVGVGNAVSDGNALARDFADAAHKSSRESVG